jgi:single-strand DNA-binding protein
MSVNKAIILGRLTKDPEIKYTPSGSAVANFSVATSEKWVDKTTSEKKEKSEFHNIVVWGKLAELCNQYTKKGKQVYVEGPLQTRSWDDEKSGKKMYRTEINAKTVQFLGGQADVNDALKKAHETFDNDKNGEYKVETDTNFASDSIPF